MIFDSVVWKEDLKNDLHNFRYFLDNIDLSFEEGYENSSGNDLKERDMTEIAFIKLQKFAIYTSIVIRKMIESKRLSDEVEQLNFPVYIHSKIIQGTINKYSLIDGIENIYDYENSEPNVINLKRLADLIIHSFIFQAKFDWHKDDESLPDEEAEFIASKVLGFYFNSDRSKDKYLYYIDLYTYFDIVNAVVDDKVVFYTTDVKGNILTKSSYPTKRDNLNSDTISYSIS